MKADTAHSRVRKWYISRNIAVYEMTLTGLPADTSPIRNEYSKNVAKARNSLQISLTYTAETSVTRQGWQPTKALDPLYAPA